MSADEYQVGGTHYTRVAAKQHWDIVADFELDYFQGQITKYLFRWKLKHKTPALMIEDLRKAKHYLEKYIELQEQSAKEAEAVRGDTDKESDQSLDKGSQKAVDFLVKYFELQEKLQAPMKDPVPAHARARVCPNCDVLVGYGVTHECPAEAGRNYVDQG